MKAGKAAPVGGRSFFFKQADHRLLGTKRTSRTVRQCPLFGAITRVAAIRLPPAPIAGDFPFPQITVGDELTKLCGVYPGFSMQREERFSMPREERPDLMD